MDLLMPVPDTNSTDDVVTNETSLLSAESSLTLSAEPSLLQIHDTLLSRSSKTEKRQRSIKKPRLLSSRRTTRSPSAATDKKESLDYDYEIDLNFGNLEITEVQQKEEGHGRKNKAFLAVKHAMEEKDREKRKKKKEETLYVDAQRNIGVVMGEKDVREDIRAKNRREGNTIGTGILIGQDEEEVVLGRGIMEMKMGDPGKAVVNLSRAVEMSRSSLYAADQFGETLDSGFKVQALVSRSQCLYRLGRYTEAVKDAEEAVSIDKGSLLGLEALGMALYSVGDFEKSMVQFYRAYGLRSLQKYAQWIQRCEETVNMYLESACLDMDLVDKMMESTGTRSRRVPKKALFKKITKEVKSTWNGVPLYNIKEEKKRKEKLALLERKATSRLMGRLADDLSFLEDLVTEPGLTSGHQVFPVEGAAILAQATQTVCFLKNRRDFWQKSNPFRGKR